MFGGKWLTNPWWTVCVYFIYFISRVTLVIPDRCGEDGAEPESKTLNLPVDL